MKFNIYSMRDQFSGYIQPTFEQNDNIAIRNFSFAINKKDTLLYANPKHFDLYKIGEFDTDTGKVKSMEPTLIVTGLSVLEQDNEK